MFTNMQMNLFENLQKLKEFAKLNGSIFDKLDMTTISNHDLLNNSEVKNYSNQIRENVEEILYDDGYEIEPSKSVIFFNDDTLTYRQIGKIYNYTIETEWALKNELKQYFSSNTIFDSDVIIKINLTNQNIDSKLYGYQLYVTSSKYSGLYEPQAVNESNEENPNEYELDTAEQEYSSADTSLRQIPAVVKKVTFEEGQIILDYGGGKYDEATEYIKDKFNATNLVYDPYNRTSSHNRQVIETIRENGGADACICANVLNVIKEEEARMVAIKNIYKLVKSGAKCYFSVYEKTGDGNAKQTGKDQWQNARPTKSYVEEISKVFSNVKCKGKIITAIK